MRVFLSYSTSDHDDADKIRRALEARRPDLDIYFAPRRNELGAYARRWGRNLLLSLSGRRLHYEPPPAASAAARSLPFAVPLAAGVALHWTWGLPW